MTLKIHYIDSISYSTQNYRLYVRLYYIFIVFTIATYLVLPVFWCSAVFFSFLPFFLSTLSRYVFVFFVSVCLRYFSHCAILFLSRYIAVQWLCESVQSRRQRCEQEKTCYFIGHYRIASFFHMRMILYAILLNR